MLNKDKSNQNEKTRNRTRYLLKEISMKNILKVRMLGGFTLEYKGKELVLDRNNVSKTTQLFQLLLLHTQDGGISKAALIDALYGRSDVENKNGSLNNTIFRLRKQLTAAGLPESSYININGGMCTWDPDIETSVDVCDFKQTIESARHEKSQKTNGNLRQSMETLHRRIPPGYDGRQSKTSHVEICISTVSKNCATT